jgi:hypothetical protein
MTPAKLLDLKLYCGELFRFQVRYPPTSSMKYPGAKILRGSEAYISMTCGRYGHLNRKLGSSETFSCPACIAAGKPLVHGPRRPRRTKHPAAFSRLTNPDTHAKGVMEVSLSLRLATPSERKGLMATEN